MNSGGIRASLDSGKVTLGEVMTILPFQNTLATFKVTGKQLLTAIENGVSEVEDVAGRFPQVSGMRFTFDASRPAGDRVTSIETQDEYGWSNLNLYGTYGMVSNNFIRGGGDGYKVFRSASDIYDFGPDLADVVADYIDANPGYSGYTDGRINQE
jgi:5'-nucleotidase